MSGKKEILKKFFKPDKIESIRIVPAFLTDRSGSMGDNHGYYQSQRRVGRTTQYQAHVYDYVMNDVNFMMNHFDRIMTEKKVEARVKKMTAEEDVMYKNLVLNYAWPDRKREESMADNDWSSNREVILTVNSCGNYTARLRDNICTN